MIIFWRLYYLLQKQSRKTELTNIKYLSTAAPRDKTFSDHVLIGKKTIYMELIESSQNNYLKCNFKQLENLA